MKARYQLVGQEFINNKTLFIFKELKVAGEMRMYASELYANHVLLQQFSFKDLLTIIHTAVQEQTLADIHSINMND